MTEKSTLRDTERKAKLIIAAVWILRIAVGATFVMSGLAKAIDIWGFVYKIEDYLAAWGVESWRSLNFVAAMGFAATEFVCGACLMFGMFRKSVVWWMLAMMAVFLPLTCYIWIYDPVPDCGCFGDFWVISNAATFIKNIFLTTALIFLAKYNVRARALVNPYIQWLGFVAMAVYILLVGLIGYNVQPLVDFRSFPIGSHLLASSGEGSDNDGDDAMSFIYEKDGVKQTFTIDNLPDSTWEFVDRLDTAMPQDRSTEFTVIDDGYDLAPEIISNDGTQFLLIITDLDRIDITTTLAINELSGRVKARGGDFVAFVAAANDDEIEEWKDISMADYEVFVAEPTLLKELSRGTMSLVKLKDGVIQWKRNAGTIAADDNPDGEPSGLVALAVGHGGWVLLLLSIVLLAFMIVLVFPSLLFHRKVGK